MLLLGRREGDTITLFTSDGPIEVEGCLVDEGQVRIGIEAPRSVEIVRSELLDNERPG